MKRIAALVCLFLTAAGVSTAASAQALPTQPLDRIAAVAEGDVILQSELDRAVHNVQMQYRNNPQQLPPHNVLQRQVLESLIMMRLQVQRAEDTGIRISDGEIDQAVQNVAQHNKISVDQLRASLQQEGVSFANFRKNLGNQLMVQKLQRRVVQNQVNVSDSEIDILLASNSLKTGEVHLQHILISVPDGASAQQLQEAQQKAENVRKQIENGMDFTAA
ncbi:MAG TPA: SurA N-terminal domain-containing protein, partial [Woeseiaceae bacterium]|nr:SurA N-terminal domain-containing protein [Woeseiaceae bacterium]